MKGWYLIAQFMITLPMSFPGIRRVWLSLNREERVYFLLTMNLMLVIGICIGVVWMENS